MYEYANMSNRFTTQIGELSTQVSEKLSYRNARETIKVIDTEYFMICDPDDWLDKNAVKTLITSANKYNLDIITGDKYNVYVDGDTTVDKANRYCDYIKPNKVYNNPRIFSLLCPSPHSKLYKTSLVKDINFPKKVNFTDFLLYMVIIAKSKKGMYIDKPFSYYLIDRIGNTSTDKSKKTYISWITVLNSSLNQINNDPYLYIRLYEQYRYTLIESFSNLSRKEKKELKKELKFIFKLKRYKKDIIKHLKNTNTKKSVWVCRLLFSRIFNYFTVLLLCRKISRVQLKKM